MSRNGNRINEEGGHNLVQGEVTGSEDLKFQEVEVHCQSSSSMPRIGSEDKFRFLKKSFYLV